MTVTTSSSSFCYKYLISDNICQFNLYLHSLLVSPSGRRILKWVRRGERIVRSLGGGGWLRIERVGERRRVVAIMNM